MRLFAWIRSRLNGPEFEPEFEEDVDHDTVIVNGKELTGDDPEEGQRQ